MHQVQSRSVRQGGKGGFHRGRHSDKCRRCGYDHTQKDDCPARRSKCHYCGKIGHYASCYLARSKGIREVRVDDDDDSSCSSSDGNGGPFLGSVTQNSRSQNPWLIKLKFCGKTIPMKIDSVMSYETYADLKTPPKLTRSKVKLASVGGKVRCHGTFTAKIKHNDQRYNLKVHVIDGQANLLARGTAAAMGLLKVNLSEVDVSYSVYGELGLMNTDPVTIRLKDDAVPYSLTTPRRVPVPLMPKVKAELQRMEDNGIITRVTDPSEWCAPMVPVMKKNRKEVRICVDLKNLNKAVLRERFILPTIDDLLPKLAGAGVFSTLDASSGFWAIPLDKESAKLTCFITPYGRFRFERLPFGISSAPEIFHQKMCELFQDQEGVVIYMDDILVFGDSREQHDERLKRVMTKIRGSGLKLNKAKCKLHQESLDFLGHHIDKHGIRPAASKVEAIHKLAPPTNLTELKRVLGMLPRTLSQGPFHCTQTIVRPPQR